MQDSHLIRKNAPPLAKEEIGTLGDEHQAVRIPVAGKPGTYRDICCVCGYDKPCPVMRLIDEVIELRETAHRYGESLHGG